MTESDRGKKRATGYDVNRRTLAAFSGLYVFNLVSVGSLIYAVCRLLPAMRIYMTDGFDMTRASEGFELGMTCFLVSMMSHKCANWCLEMQRRHKRPV